jgi:hypothetical protein
MKIELVAIGLSAGSLTIAVVTLIVALRIFQSTRNSKQAVDERLEILREQQERLRLMYQDRSMLRRRTEKVTHGNGRGGASTRTSRTR